MKSFFFILLTLSANTLAQNTLEDCNLGVFNRSSQGIQAAGAAAKNSAESLFPSYIASNPQICGESPSTQRSHGTNGSKSIVINGITGIYYNPAASIQIVRDCWVCNSYCKVFWPSKKACAFTACPNGYTSVDGRCTQYSAVVTEESPQPSCGDTVGNPISIKSGAKYQIENDIPSLKDGLIAFQRTFTNANQQKIGVWYNSYQRSLQFIEHNRIETIKAKSAAYATKEAACNNGFNDLKNQLDDSWTQQTTVQFTNGSCQVMRNNTVIRKITIIPHGKQFEKFVTPGSIQLVRADGSLINFDLTPGNQYRSQNGELGILTKVEGAEPIAWSYKDSSGTIENYNASGKLISVISSNGDTQALFYDPTSGLLSRVKDSTGRELLFAYTGNQLSSATVDGNKTTSYTYNASDLITQVTRPDNTTRIYHYEDTRFPTALTGITDERGARYATWAYDAQGRAISSEHAGGAEKTLLAFNTDGSTTVTNALNKQTIYRFDDIAGARRVIKVEGQPTANCIGANQDYTYTPEGWIASKTDWKGIKTTFTYNTTGQEISRTEAFGAPEARTITTQWHSTLFVKTKITEPEKETVYSYDANGRLLNQSTQSISVQ